MLVVLVGFDGEMLQGFGDGTGDEVSGVGGLPYMLPVRCSESRSGVTGLSVG